MKVGIALMPFLLESSCVASLSTSTLRNVTSGYCSAYASSLGATCLQGPHHSAKKSTNTCTPNGAGCEHGREPPRTQSHSI